MSAVKSQEITEGVPEKGSNEDLQMKHAAEEALACSMLSGCLLHTEEGGYPSNKLEGVTSLNSGILVFSAIITSSDALKILTVLILLY